jgi:hypothetical protein
VVAKRILVLLLLRPGPMNNDRGIKVFSGNSNIELATKIAKRITGDLGQCKVSKFANGETSVVISESSNFSLFLLLLFPRN